MAYQGDFTTSNTVYVYFDTFDSNDPSASVTLTGLAVTDIEIYKDGSVTQRSSDAGYTLLDTDGIDFDSTTGIHGFSIDLSDNTDAGFYAAGSEYVVVVASVTVDAATVNFVAATFSIERAGGVLALAKGATGFAAIDTVVDGIQTDLSNGTDGLGAIKADTAAILVDTGTTLDAAIAVIDTNVSQIETAVITNAAGVDIAADIIAIKTETASILTDTGTTLDNHLTDIKGTGFVKDTHSLIDIETYVDLIDDGTSGLAKIATDVAAILVDTGTTLDAAIAVIDTNVSQIETAVITNAAGVDIAADIIAMKAETALIVADSNELQTDWANGGRLDVILDARMAEASISTTAGAVDTVTLVTTTTTNTDMVAAAPTAANVVDEWETQSQADPTGFHVNVMEINSNTTAAGQLALSADQVESGAAEGTPSTTVIQTDLAETSDDIYIGRVVIWTSGAARGEATDITDYTGATGTLTVTALSNAPSAADTFILI